MTNTQVSMYFDATCPYAWVTSRWLKEVEKARDLRVNFIPMSLAVLNEGRDLDPRYQEKMTAAWGPARIAAAVHTEHPEKIDEYYTLIGGLIHASACGITPGDEEKLSAVLETAGVGEISELNIDKHAVHGYDKALAAVIKHLGLPEEYTALIHGEGENSEEIDNTLRTLQKQAIDLVGDDVGTPVVQFGEVAFFGPVLTRVPQGEQAGRIFDASVELSSYPHFYEIKRSRRERPSVKAESSDSAASTESAK